MCATDTILNWVLYILFVVTYYKPVRCNLCIISCICILPEVKMRDLNAFLVIICRVIMETVRQSQDRWSSSGDWTEIEVTFNRTH